MPVFRILHLSDLHLCVKKNKYNAFLLHQNPRSVTLRHFRQGRPTFSPSSYSGPIAEAVARFAHRRDGNWDVIVVSGDLATTGLEDDLRVAKAFLSGDGPSYLGLRGVPTIREAAKVIFVIPGNHDRYQNTRGDAGCRNFDRELADWWSDSGEGVNAEVIPKDGSNLALIGGDFCLRENTDADKPELMNKWGQGRAYAEVVDGLVKRTQQLKERYSSLGVVWVIHFPPLEDCPIELRLIMSESVEEAAHRVGAGGILSGHVHRQYADKTRYGTAIWGAGAACAMDVMDNNWVHVLELEVDARGLKLRRRDSFGWDDRRSNFVRLS